MGWVIFLLQFSKSFFSSGQLNLNAPHCRHFELHPMWGLLVFMDWDILFFPQIWRGFGKYFFKYSFFSLPFFWNSHCVVLTLCYKSCVLLLLLFLFTFVPLSRAFQSVDPQAHQLFLHLVQKSDVEYFSIEFFSVDIFFFAQYFCFVCSLGFLSLCWISHCDHVFFFSFWLVVYSFIAPWASLRWLFWLLCQTISFCISLGSVAGTLFCCFGGIMFPYLFVIFWPVLIAAHVKK